MNSKDISTSRIELGRTFDIYLDKENNELVIKLPKHLKIKIVNELNFQVTGGLNVFSNGEINIVSEEQNINIDSVAAKVFLNSLMSKQIKDLPESIEKREQRKKEREQLVQRAKEIQKEKSDLVNQLLEEIADLRRRIELLEKV